MTQTTKEIFETYQVRKSKKQKTSFIHYVEQVAKENEYDVKVEKGLFGARNVVIGDPDSAKVLYTAHYDTCSRLPFPNFITPKNFFVYLLYQLAIIAVALVAVIFLWFILDWSLSLIPGAEGVERFFKSFLKQFGFLIVLFLLMAGPANKNTANDNTSGVTTVLDIMKELPLDQRSKVAFVLFDLEEMGMWGSISFASKHKTIKNNTLVINFDCVSDGETMMFGLKKATMKYAELLETAFVSNDDVAADIGKVVYYPSDNVSFANGIGVAALRQSKRFGVFYMDKIHTKKDVVYREENIQFLTSGAVKVAQLL